jgi:type VI secretion system ImpC/EvpB family protein
VGDYYFDHSAPDVEMLAGISQISAASHSPFITAAAPSLLNLETWQELSNPRDLAKIFGTPEYAAWKSLRESEDARYLGLTMPRVLARLPYGAKTSPVEEFNFEEDTAGPITRNTFGPTPLTRWRRISPALSSFMVGAPVSAAPNRVEWSKGFPFIPSPLMTVVSI